MRIISRAGFNAHTTPLFKSLKILKVYDQITLLNCLFVHDYLNLKLPKSIDNTFTKLSDVPALVGSNNNVVSTINSDLGCLLLPHVSSSTYGGCLLHPHVSSSTYGGCLLHMYLHMYLHLLMEDVYYTHMYLHLLVD